MSTLLEDDWTMDATGAAANVPARKRLEGTPQQDEFWGELNSGEGHLVLEARAGTGKSSSCREGMWRLIEAGGSPSIRYCCFNKAIADEFERGCPPGVEVGTMHRFGLKSLRRAFPEMQVDAEKTYKLIDAMPGGPELKRYTRKTIAKLVGLAKNAAIRPDDEELAGKLVDLIVYFDIQCWGREDQVIAWSSKVLSRSAEVSASCDFDDMLWMPLILGLPFPRVDYLFIDEAQDLNAVQHELADRINFEGRTVVVGDPYQAIYAFRGADSRSIDRLRENLDAATLPLTITWRCPASHVALARELVSDLEASPTAIEGSVDYTNDRDGEIASAKPGDLVICRANAPLVSACLKLIGKRRRAHMRGRAFGDSLQTITRDVGGSTVPEFQRLLLAWEAKELDRLDRRDGTEHLMEQTRDKAGALAAISDTCGSPAEIPAVIANLFDDGPAEGRVVFSSVHRAKGSEAEVVRYIDMPYPTQNRGGRPVSAAELGQRRNLRYVALTRSKSSLTLINP